MNVDEELEKISSSLGELQATLAKNLPSVSDPTLQRSLDSVNSMLSEGRAEFIAEYKKMAASADEMLARAKWQSQQALAKATALEQELTAPPLPEVPPPAKPPFVVDPALGQRLRQELLDRFAPQQPEAEKIAWAATGEVWDDWYP